jgi:nucleoside-diphosphate-sugar epimerase
MKILVTGANGFVGTHLCLKLLSQGHSVYGLVRTPSKMHLTNDHFFLVPGDLNQTELSWITQLPNDLDACIHAAGLVHSYNNEDFFKANTIGTKNLIENLKLRFQKKFKFILLSSLAASGPADLGKIKDETDMDFPVSAYGRSKKRAEEILTHSAPKEWTSSIIRPPMIIGPGDVAVLDIFKMVKEGFIILPGMNSKKKEYSFVCIFDLIETISKLIESDISLLVYSAHESIISFQQLIEEIQKQLKKKWIIYIPIPIWIVRIFAFFLSLIHRYFLHNLRLTPDKINELKAMAWTCSPTRSQTLLKQTYQYDLNQTIAVTLSDYQKRKWL